MDRFLQLHFLTFYPPSNVNRDDTGNPKTANVGGATRLRISSQALKRAWRTSEIFEQRLRANMGERTQRFGRKIKEHLLRNGVDEKQAVKIAQEIAGVYGKLKKEKDSVDIEQLAFISPKERDAAMDMADRMAAGEEIDPKKEKDKFLHKADSAIDIALFGRMLADNPSYNRDAAVQVAHAITTHRVTVEDDYYTAIDDLKKQEAGDDAGAGFLSEAGFGSGVFYLYLCVNRDLFLKNLGADKDEALMATALGALAEAAATVSPSGKQNSFAALARAQYVLAEKGNAQPRTLAGAFVKPVIGTDLLTDSVKALEKFRDDLEKAYGAAANATCEFKVGGKGSLAEIAAFCQS